MSVVDHALVMDTDHIPGRGGYALVSASRGVTQAERRFVADNLGISDYLHRPANARMYFSFFRVPDGRYAFVRRFVNGTRRNGVQNRVFVHTLFLDDMVFEDLHGLPWLLADVEIRPEGSTEGISLAKVIDPQQIDPELSALEFRRPSPDEAHAALRRRVDSLADFAASTEALAGFSAKENIAGAAAALQRATKLPLPQGPAFEQLTLLTWSMLPLNDRATMAWTQHHDARTANIFFCVFNSPQAETGVYFDATDVAHRTVGMNVESVMSWVEFADTTRRYEMAWGSPEIDAWLEFREKLATLISDPLAADEVLLPHLAEVAESVRPDHRDPWVKELTILQFVWRNITRSAELGTPKGAAIERWSSLAVRSGIGRVIFRQPPADEWLDASETQVGADLLIQFFLHGSQPYAAAAATRAALARWVLRRIGDGTRVSADPLARLAVALAIDRSARLADVLSALLARPDGFRALRSATPNDDARLADAVLLAILTGLQLNHRDTAFFIKEALLPRIEIKPSTGRELPVATARSIGKSLRGDAAAFVRFAFLLSDENLTRLLLDVDEWVLEDHGAWGSLARMLLQRAQTEGRVLTVFARLAFTVASQREKGQMWLPAIVAVAKELDRSSQTATAAAFTRKAATLGPRFGIEPETAETVLDMIREHAAAVPVGACLRALLLATRPAWPHIRGAVPAVETIVAAQHHRAIDWEWCVLALMQSRGNAARSALATFWQRLGAEDVLRVSPASVRGLQMVGQEARAGLVKTWSSRLSTLPAGTSADDVVTTLRAIAPPEFVPQLEIEIAMRELAKRVDTPQTWTRLDLALQAHNPRKRAKNLAEAMEKRLRIVPAAHRAAWLIELFAASCTLPTTQHVIEEKLLPHVAKKMEPEDWLRTIEQTKEGIFVFDYFAQDIARRVAAAKAHDAGRMLLGECLARNCTAGIDALVAGSKGILMPATVEGTV
jgi:hypothetical protein